MLSALEVTGVAEASDLLGLVNDQLEHGLKDRLRQGAELLEKAAVEETHSQRMRSALTSMVEVKSLTDYTARVYPRGKWAFLARFLEGGTRPHAITTASGRTFQHPGTRPQPFLMPALERHEDDVVELVGIPPVLR